VEEHSESVSVRQDTAEPVRASIDHGAMVTVIDGDGIGYAATSDLSDEGLRWAIARAVEWARLALGRCVFAGEAPRLPRPHGRYASPVIRPMDWSKADRIDVLMRESEACRLSDRIVDWQAALWTISTQQMLITADGQADDAALQEFQYTIPSLHVVAHADGLTQTRSWGGRYNGFCQQGGLEVVERSGFIGSGRTTAEEALQLLAARNCPNGRIDVVLMPDQMMLQIHESIGHPLELDRILGDERNYAGTSFVTLDMFGTFQYGSPLLNVTYDPTRGKLRIRRRRHQRAARLPDPGWAAAAPARRHLLAAACAAGDAVARGRGNHARVRVEPAADRPHEQPQCRAGREFARRDDCRHRTRRADEDQPLVVD
jgi:predicted Zn-dependent protease